MKKVLILQGLPASGKSTYAKELVKKGYKRVNKDDLRLLIDNGKYSKRNEILIQEIRDMIIDLSLINGFNVVVDDTNFETKHFKQISMIADINDAEVDVKVFRTPLEECLSRDAKRKNSVGKDVIIGMYNRYVRKE